MNKSANKPAVTRYSVIVTKSVKGVYQNPTYMNALPAPKICLANKANPD